MASTADAGEIPEGLDSLHRLKLIEPPLFLSPSKELSEEARLASRYLFASLKPFVPKCPFSQLLTKGFDSEQIWQQIDLQSQPLVLSLHRQVKHFQEKPEEIEKQFNLDSDKIGNNTKEDTEDGDMVEDDELVSGEGEESDGLERESGSFDEDEDEEEEEGDGDEDGDDDNDEDDTEMENENDGDAKGVEDRFLKIKELEEYLVDDEEKEYGVKKEHTKRKRGEITNEDEDDEDEDDELGLMGLDDEDDGDEMESARYEDFFGGKRTGKGKSDDGNNNQKNTNLSTHEKELEKIRSEIEEMENANLEPKTWMMQGEVTAAKRPKNSALEVDLDFEHNVRPAPVITEEVTASLEELIKKRIVEGHFDDVEKPATLPSKSPREKIELDENKSQKGLAALYEDEYVQKTGLVSTALSFADEQKKEATLLFKKLCLKLDALSHFHFTPKPVIEDMSIQTNVPALAMEEIAPVAVSDAAMLAPEEVFTGKGDVKEETELTKTDRKRRRANKKRKFKAEDIKRGAGKAQLSSATNNGAGNEE